MRLSWIVIFLLAAASASITQTQPPDTPAGRQCAAWLESFNRGDREAHKNFLQKNFPSKVTNLDRDLDFRQRTGGFDFKKVEESTPTRVVALVQERASDQFARLTLEVDGSQPAVITKLGLEAIPRPADFAVPRLTATDLAAAVKKNLEEESAADHFAGAVLIAQGGKPVFSEAYGLADREHKIPNTVNTRFRIGSMNKMFTAVAILQLVQAGKLDLNDVLGKHLTDYPNHEIATKVTIHELLTHTGGTGDIFGPEFDAHRLELRTLQDYLKLYGSRGPQFEPGSRFEYSNYGFVLLGAIIDKVSGQSYYDYVRDHIYAPAGMSSTGSEPEAQAVVDRSIGYTRQGDNTPFAPNTDTLPYRGSSAGGGYSTVEDLLRFATALQENKLLNQRFTEMLTEGKPETPNHSYAYGFGDRMINGQRCFGHGGGAPGMNGDLEICPANGYVVAVLANMDPPAATRIADFIANRLPQK